MLTDRWFRWWFRGVFALCVLWGVYVASEAIKCNRRGGVFIATNFNWPTCIPAEVLRGTR
jgi:hypothetical protein